ncbi:MerR family transcriptional regulator [Ktedonosporobacter rubrisoli]|uniref:MerR family transcriptional regulator n=2 Tax=Ktedonosporobacter rubrisoli TaxID=2509675 RepID=A0A4P6K5A6_KTERU|nr:MerR family transcriptional regulator [Ktedonosporobacter rubrisoli]
MTIGELAARFGLAPHVLRHWEAMGLLIPAAGVSGRRRYNQGHSARVAMIVYGKQAGFGLKELREMLDAPDPSTRRARVKHHHLALQRRIAQAQAAKEMVEHILKCPVEDFTQCPNFQQLAQQVATRVPSDTTVDLSAQAWHTIDR